LVYVIASYLIAKLGSGMKITSIVVNFRWLIIHLNLVHFVEPRIKANCMLIFQSKLYVDLSSSRANVGEKAFIAKGAINSRTGGHEHNVVKIFSLNRSSLERAW